MRPCRGRSTSAGDDVKAPKKKLSYGRRNRFRAFFRFRDRWNHAEEDCTDGSYRSKVVQRRGEGGHRQEDTNGENAQGRDGRRKNAAKFGGTAKWFV